MLPRKPAGDSWESWVDQQIREAQDRGDFDDLAGAGRPLAEDDRHYDELWWVRKKLKEENLSHLPPTLQVRKDVEDARERIARAASERQVRRIVAEINERVREVNRTAVRGPASTVMPLDVDRMVRRWRRDASDDVAR